MTRDDLLAVLQRHIGAASGIHITQLVYEATGAVGPVPYLERQVRELVVQLRMEGVCVCADPVHGYFIAANAAEIDATCEFLYGRALTSLEQIARLKKISLPDLRGQLKLPT